MAKKIIFEGVVNGEVFHNVEEYNAAVQKAIKTGGELNCQSTTKAVDEPEPEEVILMTPFFENLDQNYITTLLDSDDLEGDVKAALDTVKANIQNVEDLEEYKDSVDKVMTQINSDFTATADAISKLEMQLKQLHTGLGIIRRASNLYDEISDLIDSEDENRNKKAVVEEKQAPIEGAPVFDEQANNVAAGIRRLLKAIGLDVDDIK